MARTYADPVARFAASTGHPAAVAGAATLIVVGSILVQGWRTAVGSEYGGLEVVSVLIAAWCALLTALLVRNRFGRFWYVPAVFSLLALRELDFHDWFFEPGLLHAGIFATSAPLWQKAVSAAVMIAILWTLIRAIAGGVPRFWRGLRELHPWALVLFVSVGCAFVANTIDGAGRKLAPVGILISRETERALALGEEFLELGFFLGLMLTVALFVRRHAN